MRRRVYWMMVAPLGTLSAASHSQQLSGEFMGYYCTLQSAHQTERGSISPAAQKGSLVGQSFLVERSTGRIDGSLFEPDRWEVGKIVDLGSNAQAYKVVFVTPPHVSVRLLVGDEYQEGPLKRFVLMDNAYVYVGLCEHLKVKWRRIKRIRNAPFD